MIQNVVTMSGLAEKIRELEALQLEQVESIKMQAQEILHDLKPSVLAKKAFNQIAGNQNLRNSAIDTSLGIGAGFIVRKLFTFNSKNIFRKLTGYAVQAITTKLVAKKISAQREKITDL